MKSESIVAILIYTLIMSVCAWAAFLAGAWIIGTLCMIGIGICAWGVLKLAGAWSDPKPWDGDGE